jgi:transcriptional regulator with XRE-family HTH domain
MQQSWMPGFDTSLWSVRSALRTPGTFSVFPAELDPSLMESFGERLRRLREEKGFSVADLSSAVGVSESAIRQLEAGNVKSPSFALGLRIAIQLNADPFYLALGEGSNMIERFEMIERRLGKLERRLASLPVPRR